MVFLRAIELVDQERMLDILTCEQVNRTYMLPDFSQREEAIPLFSRLMEMCLDTENYVRAIVTEDGLVGFLNSTGIQGTKIELGYVIHPSFQGRGYMSKALQLAMDELFALGYDEILTSAFSTNTPSIRVMEKCGLTKLGKTEEIQYRGATHTCVYYSKKQENRKSAWNGTQAAPDNQMIQ